MDHATQLALLDRLLARLDAGEPELAPHEAEIPAQSYTDPARAADEISALFRRLPLILAHESRLAATGDFFVCDALGLPILATCDRDGTPRAFLNVCRHRGTRLVSEACGRDRKAMVCPYHGWTYDLGGDLTHVPDAYGFPSLDRARRGLVELPLAARHGFLWALPVPGASLDVRAFLGETIDNDLANLHLDHYVVYRKVTQVRRANWKLILDAFLEGYHVKHLHRRTLHRFFRELVYIHDFFPPHARMLSTRTDTRELQKRDRSTWSVLDFTTLYYLLFPNTILLFHPGYVSLLRAFPRGTDQFVWDHEMLIPAGSNTPEMAPHWEKSFSLIEETVFQAEDIAAAESIQAGLRSGANEALLLGRFEFLIRYFHDQIDAAIASASLPR